MPTPRVALIRGRRAESLAKTFALFGDIGGQIRRRREGLGLTVQEAAKRSGIELERYRLTEQGANLMLTVKGLEEIATALDCIVRVRLNPDGA